MKGRPARLISLVLPPAVAMLAGCGGGGAAATFTGPDPATLTPADVPFFGEAVVRPEGDQKEALDSALSKLLATDDPGGFLVDKLDQEIATPGRESRLTYEQDVRPWLGQRAGFFLEGFKRDEEGAPVMQGATIVATTDPVATQRAIDQAASAASRKRSYKHVDYELDSDGDAAGIVGDFLVFGTEPEFREAVDVSQGNSLAESASYKTQLDQAPDDLVAFAYGDPQGVVDALEKSGQLTAGQVSSGGSQLDALLSQPVAVWISATSDQIAVQASAAATAAATSQESSLLRDFPEDAWLAFAASDAGQLYGRVLDQIHAGAGSSYPSLGTGLGFDLGGQVSHWAGDIGGFAGGTSLFGLSGALVLETNDEQASAQTLDQLQRALASDPALNVSPLTAEGEHGFSLTPAGVPIQFQVVQRDGKVVAGLTDSVEEVFSPTSTLDDSDAFNSAADALGEDFAPVTFVDFGPLFQLVDGFPQAQSDPGYQSAKPYLDHLDYFVLGARRDQDRAQLRMALGLKDAPSQAGEDSSTAPPAVVAR